MNTNCVRLVCKKKGEMIHYLVIQFEDRLLKQPSATGSKYNNMLYEWLSQFPN